MQAKIRKWGNSQGLRLSQDVLELAHFKVGDEVEITVSPSQIVLRKVRKYELAELVSRIPSDYQAEEVDFGPSVGNEFW